MRQPLEWINCNQNIASIGLELKKGKSELKKLAKTNFFALIIFK